MCNNSLIIICAVLITAVAVACAVYLILALIQMRKTAKEMESALKKVNHELELVNKVSDTVADIGEKFSAPVISALSAVFYILTGLKSKKK